MLRESMETSGSPAAPRASSPHGRVTSLDHQLLWQNACQLIKLQMPSVSYRTWIEEGLTPVKMDGQSFYVRASSDFVCTFVEKNWADQLTLALSQAADMPVNLRLLGEHDDIASDADDRPDSGAARSAEAALNPSYTFDTFVVGGSNRFAHAASLAVAESPAVAYNPLFLYGGVGLGKTHLMHAIGHFVLKRDPHAVVRYVTTETFTNELIEAIRQKRTQEFRDRFRHCDLLLVDDIQFLARKESTQEEFFHTFNDLQQAGKQIVLTADKLPQEIPKLEERLSSRFSGGLIADIGRPDFETRVAILQKKCADLLLPVDMEVLESIASKVDSNIRELEGCLKRLSAYASLTGRPIDMRLAEDALREVFRHAEPRHLTCTDVIETVARYYSLPAESLTGPRRSREITVPRQIAMYLCRQVANVSYPRIGDAFGRDHSTVQHGCDKIQQERAFNASLNTVLSDLSRQLREQ